MSWSIAARGLKRNVLSYWISRWNNSQVSLKHFLFSLKIKSGPLKGTAVLHLRGRTSITKALSRRHLGTMATNISSVFHSVLFVQWYWYVCKIKWLKVPINPEPMSFSFLFFLMAVLTSALAEFCKTSLVFLHFSHHCYILQDNLQYTKKKSISFVDCLCVSEG